MSAVALSIITATLLSLSLSSFNFWQFAWFGFIPLFIALENKSLRQSFVLAYLCGIIFWAFTVYWLVHVTLLGTAILVLYLALYFGLFGLGAAFIKKPTAKGIIFLPCFWVLLEYTRSYLFTGFPWALIGFSQSTNLPVIQLADITGAWGVSFLVVLVNVTAYSIIRRQSKLKIYLIPAAIIFLSLGYGVVRLSYKPDLGASRKFKISVIQGNIPQNLKWNKQAVSFIQNNYNQLTVLAAKDNPDLIIWPEASVPALWGQDDIEFEQVYSLARREKISLLAGAVRLLENNYYNSALFIDRSGILRSTYNKLHLVPFGEFVPLKNIFPFLESIAPIGDITPGREYTIFKYPADFGVLICFEDLFPELSRQFVQKGARFLVNITNDAWYKKGSAPYQHFAASVFRAVENRVYLARSANTGISGFIDPKGKILSVVNGLKGNKIFVAGFTSQDIYLEPFRRTFYNHYGDFFIVFCLLLDAGVIIFILKNRK
ncbi:MAG: apolipoprotein N-acyltransferase [Candidatus Omnitrophota bacterium]